MVPRSPRRLSSCGSFAGPLAAARSFFPVFQRFCTNLTAPDSRRCALTQGSDSAFTGWRALQAQVNFFLIRATYGR
jgi:hypothetical protein